MSDKPHAQSALSEQMRKAAAQIRDIAMADRTNIPDSHILLPASETIVQAADAIDRLEGALLDAIERCARVAEETYAGDRHHEHLGRRIADKIRDKALEIPTPKSMDAEGQRDGFNGAKDSPRVLGEGMQFHEPGCGCPTSLMRCRAIPAPEDALRESIAERLWLEFGANRQPFAEVPTAARQHFLRRADEIHDLYVEHVASLEAERDVAQAQAKATRDHLDATGNDAMRDLLRQYLHENDMLAWTARRLTDRGEQLEAALRDVLALLDTPTVAASLGIDETRMYPHEASDAVRRARALSGTPTK